MRPRRNKLDMQVERLESREVLSTVVQAPNPGDPQAERSGNRNAVKSSQVTGNGPGQTRGAEWYSERYGPGKLEGSAVAVAMVEAS